MERGKTLKPLQTKGNCMETGNWHNSCNGEGYEPSSGHPQDTPGFSFSQGGPKAALRVIRFRGWDPVVEKAEEAFRGAEGVRLGFRTAVGRLYRIDVRTALDQGDWSSLTNNVPGTGDWLSIEDSTGTGAGYYRGDVSH